MATEQFRNLATTTLSGSITNSQTTLVVASAVGFPTVPQFRINIENELMLVTGVSGTTFTVTREIEGTSRVAHDTGVPVSHVVTVTSLELAIIQQPNNYLIVSDNYTILDFDYWIEVTVAGKIITLITASGRAGKSYGIINASSGNITIQCTGAETISGYDVITLYPTETLTVVSNGTNYKVT